MATAGIICEYNPFHLGHEYQLAQTRKALGGEAGVVCVMSGNFVQRGECAVADKWARAGWALTGGADLVLELPTVWATSSAEGFARGAVEILAATGVVDTLSFGSECGDLAPLRVVAACLNTAEYNQRLVYELDKGVSFPAARARAVKALAGKAAEVLGKPNNNLAVEYLRALPPHIGAVTVRRVGADHDGGAADGCASASAIRALLRAGDLEGAKDYLPAGAQPIGAPAGLWNCERAVLLRLRGMGQADFAGLPDGGEAEGLPARLEKAAREAVTLEEFYEKAKTKRYTHARIRRLALWAFLGLTAADRPAQVPYLRVLGMNGRGKGLLGQMKKCAALPVIVKPAHAKGLDQVGRRLFELEARCTDFYGLCMPEVPPCGREWTTGPVVR